MDINSVRQLDYGSLIELVVQFKHERSLQLVKNSNQNANLVKHRSFLLFVVKVYNIDPIDHPLRHYSNVKT